MLNETHLDNKLDGTSTSIRDDEDNLVGQSDFTSTMKGQNHDEFFYYFASQQRV